jgi:hypothetical protein
MVGTTDTDRTEKLGITLPISLLRQIENRNFLVIRKEISIPVLESIF